MSARISWTTAALLAVTSLVAADTGADTGELTVEAPEVTTLRGWWADLDDPTRITLDEDGLLYIAQPGRGEVVVRAEDGRLLERIGDLGRPVSVAIDASGRLLVGDGQTGAVTAYEGADHTPAFVLGYGEGEFGQPSDISVDADSGDIYVVDSAANTVSIYDSSGTLRSAFDGSDAGDGGLDFPTGVHVDSDYEEVFVVDLHSRLIRVFDLDGTWLRDFGAHGGEEGELYGPQGVTVDEGRRVYVADSRLGRVVVFNPDGDHLLDIGDVGQRLGQLRAPLDVAVDDSGRLFVANHNNARLELLGLDDYDDPEVYVPAEVGFTPQAIYDADVEPVEAIVQVRGYRAADIDAGSLTANGVAASDYWTGDHDWDGVQDLLVTFDRAALLATLPAEGEAEVTVEGTASGLIFSEVAAVEVIEGSSEDDGPEDGDTGDTGDTGAPAGDGDTGGGDTGVPSLRICAVQPGGAPPLAILLLMLAARRRRSR